jgi:energy-coupling factor transporter ATP-binding protein EcfA2
MALRPLPPKQDSPRPTTANKQFAIEQWDGSKTGEKIILYGETGMGKTTLASMAPNPVFIGLDDGGRKLHHPKTGELLRHIPDVNTFEDVRGALTACLDLACSTVVIDTGTLLESLAEVHVLKTVPSSQNTPIKNLEGYGYGKGYKHLYDTMRLPLLDCDKLIEAGKNVIVICQSVNNKIANPAGEDYLCNEPRLYHSRQYSVLLMWCEWADHILRIDYQGTWVNKKNKQDAYGKVTGDTTRVVQTKEETYFKAKSRTLEEPVISFSAKHDNSLWQLLFKGN